MRNYVTEKANRFFENHGAHGGLLTNIKSWFAETVSGALGHGSVATFPDRPYLVWSFEYERSDAIAGLRSTRNNPVTFLAGCRALHDMFRRFVGMQRDAYGSGNHTPDPKWLQEVSTSSEMLIELPWYSLGKVYFRFDLHGAESALREAGCLG